MVEVIDKLQKKLVALLVIVLNVYSLLSRDGFMSKKGGLIVHFMSSYSIVWILFHFSS